MTPDIGRAPIGGWCLARADPWDRHSPDPAEADHDEGGGLEVEIFLPLGDEATSKASR